MKSHSEAVVSDEHLAASAEKWGQTEGAEWTKEAVWIRDIFESEFSLKLKEDESKRERRADHRRVRFPLPFLQSTSLRRLPPTLLFGESLLVNEAHFLVPEVRR